MTGLMLILSYGGNAQRMLAQTQDSLMAKDTVRQVNVPKRSAEDNEYTPLERFLPPSPQAAALARYGEYPVSLATGVPEISIPLYEIKLGDYTLPISISYHASGIKVDDVASTVGLGWVLNAGGVVSRTICGAPDLKSGNSQYNYYYRNINNVQSLYQQAKESGLNLDILNSLTTNSLDYHYDTLSDRYSYNFGQYTGVFRYSYEDNKYVLLNHQPLYIYASSGEDSYFTIVDGNGIKYDFTEQEWAGIDTDENTTEISSWYLTDIHTPYGNIHFNYQQASSDVYTYTTSQTTRLGKFYHNSSPLHFSFATTTEEDTYRHSLGETKYLYRQKLISSITWAGGSIRFTYNSNREDIGADRLTKMEVKNAEGSVYKTVTFSNGSYYGNSIYNKRMMLRNVSLSDEGTYSFSYNDANGYLPDYSTEGHRVTNCKTDFWGYYNGSNTKYHIPQDVLTSAYYESGLNFSTSKLDNMKQYAGNRAVNFGYMKYGILEDITYPTGGRTHYEYEANGTGTLCGGLHVSKITDYSAADAVLKTREYGYIGGRTHDPVEDMMTYTTYHHYLDVTVEGKTVCNYTTCTSSPFLPLNNGNGSPVFFSSVSEVSKDGSNVIGQVKYDFIDGQLYGLGEGPTTGSSYIYPGFLWPGIHDEGSCSPLMTAKRIYNGTETQPVLTETYSYDGTEIKSFPIGTKLVSVITVGWVNGEKEQIGSYEVQSPYILFQTETAHVKTFSLMTKTVTDNLTGISTTETYTYDIPLFRTLQPKTITTTNSDGKTFKTINTYTFESNELPYTTMASDYNMVDQVIETKNYCNNLLLKTQKNTFLSQNDWYYPEYIYESRLNSPLVEKLHLTDYDTHGNPRTVIENQTDKTALVWGFKSSWPVAKISGLSYAELNSLVSSQTLNNLANDSTEAQMTGNLASLRSGVGQNRLVTTYNYKPLFGVSAITAENGYTTYYDYGTDGKLSAIRDNSGPLQQFSYQYARPYTGSNDGTNFVQTTDMLSSTAGKITRQYYDGLGRPIETATDIAGKYVYTMQTYDQKGRVSQQWLPAVGGTDCAYMTDIPDISRATYDDDYAYSITTYDAIDRPVFIQTPGDAWHSAGKGITKEYITNAANSVKRYSAALDGSSLIKNGYYAANTLYGEKTTDEDGKSLTVFTDKRGRKVLERRGANNDTYYIYDDLDQLRFVLSPQYQESGFKDTYGYEYRYDEKGRLAKKILPQCGFTQYWYDTAGRMKFMQDSTLRAKRPGLYRFYLYDKYGRLCIQGTCTGCWRGEAVNTANYIGSNGGFHSTGYSVSRTDDISSTGVTIEQVNYYDSYDFVDALYSGNSLSQTSSVSTKGLLTGMRQTASDGTMLLNANYYDYKGRVTDVRSTTLSNRRMRVSNIYNYWGGITQTQQYVYSASGTQELYVTGSNTYYNNTNLLYSSTRGLRIGTGSAHSATIHELTYDDLGRVNTDKRGKSTYNTLTYRYNVHGWLDSLGTTAFQERLYYADAPYGATPCYNGNISVQQWKQSNEGFNRGYKFTYDALNRLTEAVYGENDFSDNLNDYNEKVVEYSLNGMMKRFQRRGKKSDGEYGKVDNLHIHLDGNRPVEISDDAALQTVYGAMEFRDGSTSGTEYYYDGNGSLVADANKGIAMIEYDNLNYPRRIQFTNGNTIEYVYSPDGQKLRAKWQTAAGNVVVPLNTTLSITASSTTQTDYVGDLIYTGTGTTSAVPTLSKILYPDGYFMRTSGTSGVFRYFVKDHLGNNRVVNNGSTVYQRTHYYPFGGTYADVGTASDYQPYKYNGKELDRMHGLDLYDYGARQYDPIVPMFTQQDPLTEKYYHLSPYAYCANNPVNAIDYEGKFPWIIAGSIIGASFEGAAAFYQGKSSREILGATVKGAIEGAVMSIPFANAYTAIGVSAGTGAIGSIVEQTIGNGDVKSSEVLKSTLSGSISGVASHVVSKAVDKVSKNAISKIEAKYSSNEIKKNIKKEIQAEMRQTGNLTKGKRAHQQVNSSASKRIKILKEAEKSEVELVSKVADFSQQKINSENADWICNGFFDQYK